MSYQHTAGLAEAVARGEVAVGDGWAVTATDLSAVLVDGKPVGAASVAEAAAFEQVLADSEKASAAEQAKLRVEEAAKRQEAVDAAFVALGGTLTDEQFVQLFGLAPSKKARDKTPARADK